MANITSFYSERKFYGDALSFPHGIARSGEFTREQASLLIDHGWAYLALSEGNQAPLTSEEKSFVAVCQGKQEAETAHERVWALYCLKTSTPKTMVSSPFVNCKPQEKPKTETSHDDNFESSAL